MLTHPLSLILVALGLGLTAMWSGLLIYGVGTVIGGVLFP